MLLICRSLPVIKPSPGAFLILISVIIDKSLSLLENFLVWALESSDNDRGEYLAVESFFKTKIKNSI